MKKYICTICGYVYDEEKGIPEAGIPPKTKWEDLPSDWKCPLCGAQKSDFKELVTKSDQVEDDHLEAPEVMKELSSSEMSIICSNLSRGCEKQYLSKEAEAFKTLADFFKRKTDPVKKGSTKELINLIEKDLETRFPYANKVAKDIKDRGALRSLVWSEKVTRMLSSILKRYEEEGDNMLSNTGIYVCTVCGFISVGLSAPEQCPVCKVPSWKFEKVEGRTV